MNIREFSHNLQKLYQEMSDSFSSYQNSAGLACLSSCGRCCLNPEIEASLHEMIPMALSIYDEGKLDEWIERLSNPTQEHCLVYVPGEKVGEGKCGRYHDRPSLCRMFGVAGYRTKNDSVTLSICKFIKEHYELKTIPSNLNPEETPLLVEWTFKLTHLEPKLIQEKLPINQALLRALEKVALYAEYQEQ